MSFNRIKHDAGFVDPDKVEKSQDGLPLCRWCKTAIQKGSGRRTFCGDECVHEWKIRSQPGYARDLVWERDKGVCALCKVDTLAAQNEMLTLRDRLKEEIRKQAWQEYNALPVKERGDPPTWQHWRWWADKIYSHPEWVAASQRYGYKVKASHDISPWQADHIIPVAEGGGECGLENLRTLCRPCHGKESGALRKRLNLAKRQSKGGQEP
jgi:5-methylcytosine-specific restriction enzyme A